MRLHVAIPRSRAKKPTHGRCFVVALVLTATALSTMSARAQVWTEEAIVARALEVVPLDELREARADAERGAGRTAAAWAPLELAYTREQTFGAGATGEDYVGLNAPLDLANRRGLRGEAFEHRARAAEAEVDALRRERIRRVRRLFHRLAAGRARASALEAGIAHIDHVLSAVNDRVSAGDAARYELLRLERERATAGARLDVERASLARTEAELGSMIGAGGAPLTIAAEPLPDAPPPLESLLAVGRTLPRVRVWEERETASRLDAEAGARGWFPDLALALGWKGVDQYTSRTDGFYAGIVVSLPIFDPGVGERQRAEAQGRVAMAERTLALSAIERAIRGGYVECTRLREAVLELGEASAARSEELVRIASASFAGGEASLLELLDAARGATEDQLVLVDLALRAWEARIDLDRIAGREVFQ